jgi:hypothetical protein
VVSSSYGGSWDVTKLIDGSSQLGWSTQAGQTTNQWAIVELANSGTYAIDRVRLNPSATSGDGPEMNLRDFEIRVSMTDTQPSSFTTVVSATAPQQNAFFEYRFPAASAR